jgi:Domain of unknown function (DUF3387)
VPTQCLEPPSSRYSHNGDERICVSLYLRELVHEVVQSVKRNPKVDWKASRREDVKAVVYAAVKRALIKKGVKQKDSDVLLAAVWLRPTRHSPMAPRGLAASRGCSTTSRFGQPAGRLMLYLELLSA